MSWEKNDYQNSNTLFNTDRYYDPQTPDNVLRLLKSITNSQSIFVPFTTKTHFIESLADKSDVFVTKDGTNLAPELLMRMSNSKNVSLVNGVNEVPDSHIVLDPPFGLRSKELKYGLRDEGLIHFTEALSKLGVDKYAMITTPIGVTFRLPELRWLIALREKGIYLQSLVQLPAGTYNGTGIGVVLLIFSRQVNDKYLSVELKDDNADPSIERIKGWLQRSEKSQNDTGLVVYEPGKALQTSEKIRRTNMLSKTYAKQGFPVINILEGSRVTSIRGNDRYTDEVNTIYLPNIGLSNVVTTTSDMTMKNQSNYFQITLTDRSDAEYIARLLNTNVGKTAREDFMSGSFISRINLASIKDGEFYLPVPPPAEQRKISALNNRIETSINQLRSMQEDLDNHPKKLRDIKTSYGQMIQGDNNAWVELLPAHLSIMLKKYYVAPKPEQYKRLLEFFEALNHLFAAIYFSFLKNSPSDKLWESFKHYNTDLDLNRVFNQSNFGSWYKFMSVSGNYIRAARAVTSDNLYPNKTTIDQAMDITSPQLVLDIINTMISTVTKIAQEERNKDAHSFDSKQNAEQLQKLLNDIQPKLVSIFSHYKLISFKQALAGEGELRPYIINILHGTSTVFQTTEVEFDQGINDRDIYLYEEDTIRVLKMQPILRLMGTPPTVKNTVYYFDKKVGDESVYKAYLDAGEAEVRIADSGIEY